MMIKEKSHTPVNVRIRKARGAALIEVSLLVSIILVVVLQSVTSVGVQARCVFVNTAKGIEYATIPNLPVSVEAVCQGVIDDGDGGEGEDPIPEECKE